MAAGDRGIARVISVAAAVLAALACLLPPGIYLAVSYERERATLQAEAELTAQLVGRIVTENPDLWRFEQVRLTELLARRPRSGDPERRRVLDLDGNVAAESADPLPRPWVRRSFQLRDAGARVGEVEIARSLRPVVFHTGLLVLVLAPVAFLAFQVLRTIPLRAIRRSERALRRQRDAAQRYLDVAGVAVVLVDARGRVSLVNRKGAEILGRPVSELVGKDWVDAFVDPAERARVAPELARLARSDRVLELEHGVIRPSGERRVVSWFVTPLSERGGGLAGVLASGIDVTNERQLEAQLRQAHKMEAVGELASGVAHGFNNILSTIKGYAALLRRELPPGDSHLPDVDEILAAADRAAMLTRSLLTFARHTKGEPEPADLAELVRRSERPLRSLLGDDVQLEVAAAAGDIPVRVDALQIEQVLMNLVANARDAMPGGGRVVVAVARVDLDAETARRAGLERPGAYGRVTVADTGVGIAREDQARIFEPFFTTKAVDKGTGLGLSLAYGIMRQHGGAISVESEPGRGATFTCLLPLRDGEAGAQAPGQSNPGADASAGPRGQERAV
jgi:two-component system cell cycle sensor histidine kinase/response regulator CckA